jgi:hypothetical protein
MVDISGLEKWAVLKVLYDRTNPQGMGFLHFVEGDMSEEEARAIVERTLVFDYLKGRVMKVDISGDRFDPWGYDLPRRSTKSH